jgi:hypothetical protein
MQDYTHYNAYALRNLCRSLGMTGTAQHIPATTGAWNYPV